MCLIHCNARITETPSGAGVHREPRHDYGPHQSTEGCHRNWQGIQGLQIDTGNIGQGRTIFAAIQRSPDGVRPPWTDNWSAAGDHEPTDITVPNSTVPPLDVWTSGGTVEAGAGRSQDNFEGGRDRQGIMTWAGQHHTGHETSRRRSPRLADAAGECTMFSGSGNPNCPPATRGPRTDDSRLPGLCRIVWNSVERLDCSILDGHMIQAHQHSRWTMEEAVPLPQLQWHSHKQDITTRSGGWRNCLAGPTMFCTTPGPSFWGPRPGSHCGRHDVRNELNQPRVLSVLCWVLSHCWGPGLDPFSFMKCFMIVAVGWNGGLLYI